MPDIKVVSEIAAKVWKIEAAIGDALELDDTIMILESMKMEIPVGAPRKGRLADLLVAEGDSVAEGQAVAILASD